MKNSSIIALLFITLFALLVFADELPKGVVLSPTTTPGVMQFTWDVAFAPALPKSAFSATGIQQALENFTALIAGSFLKDLEQKIGLVGLVRHDNDLYLRVELLNDHTIRASSFYSSLKDSPSYIGYANFAAATTPAGLAVLLQDIPALKIDGTSFPWTSVDSVVTYRLPISCFNNVQDDNETDIDVGGSSDCSRAWPGFGCTQNNDCVEYSICEDTKDDSGNKKCSDFTSDASVRGFEASRTGANSSILASTMIAIAIAALAMMF